MFPAFTVVVANCRHCMSLSLFLFLVFILIQIFILIFVVVGVVIILVSLLYFLLFFLDLLFGLLFWLLGGTLWTRRRRSGDLHGTELALYLAAGPVWRLCGTGTRFWWRFFGR